MLVTFTNIGTQAIFVSNIYQEIAVGGSVQAQRSGTDIERDQNIRQMIADGVLSLSFTPEAADSVAGGASFQASPPQYGNLTRPSPAAVPLFSFIWNTDDNAYNYSDGTNWRDAAGAIT